MSGNFASASGRALTAIHHDRSAEMKMAFTSWSKVGKMMEEPGDLSGLRRWGIVAAAFLSCFTCFGVGYSFGAFFDSMSEEFSSGKGLTALMFSLTTCFYFLGGLITGRLADRFGPRRGVRRSYQHGNRSLPHVSRASDLGWIHHLWRWSRHSYGMWIRADGCDGWRMVQQTPNVGTRNCGVGHRRRNTRLCPACGITYRSVRMENDVRGVCNWRYGGSSHCIGWSGDATSCWRWGRGSASDARSRPTVYHPVFRVAHYNDGAVCPVRFHQDICN